MYVSNTNKITKHHEQGGRDLIGGVYSYRYRRPKARQQAGQVMRSGGSWKGQAAGHGTVIDRDETPCDTTGDLSLSMVMPAVARARKGKHYNLTYQAKHLSTDSQQIVAFGALQFCLRWCVRQEFAFGFYAHLERE